MQAHTIEYQRFGDPSGIIRLSDRYIRTLGPKQPTVEISVGVAQEQLEPGMATLDYSRAYFDKMRNK